MKDDTPITLAVATYGNRAGAVGDFDRVMDAKKSGAFDHIAVAVITKDVDGKVEVERHEALRSISLGAVRSSAVRCS